MTKVKESKNNETLLSRAMTSFEADQVKLAGRPQTYIYIYI